MIMSKIAQSVHRERGQWAVYYTSPQSFINNVFLFVGLTTLRTLVNFDWFVHSIEYSYVSTTNYNLQKGSFYESSIGMYIILSAIALSLLIPGIEMQYRQTDHNCIAATILLKNTTCIPSLRFGSVQTLCDNIVSLNKYK